MSTIAVNKRANFDYEIIDKYEAGLILSGAEVKSIKTGHISLKGSFVTFRGTEPFLTNADIPFYKFAGNPANYDSRQPRKLLLKKSEIKNLLGKIKVKGLTLVPIRVYTKKRLIKLEFGVGRGKKEYDKREADKKRTIENENRRIVKSQKFDS